MKKWSIIFGAFFFSYGLATAAYLWRPPEVAYHEMVRAAQTVPAWHVQLEGTLEGIPFKGDLVKRPSGDVLLRISYRPLKLLNNQWIHLYPGEATLPEQNGDLDLFHTLALTRRLRTVKKGATRFWRYAFTPSPLAASLIPSLAQGQGEIWFKPHVALPSFMELTFASATITKRRADRLLVTNFYSDPFGTSTPRNIRELADVLTQLEEVQKAHLVKPEALVPLRSDRNNEEAWQSDFDHDGVTDAVELFYGTDSANPDTDDDTFLDGDEIGRGYNPAGEGSLKE